MLALHPFEERKLAEAGLETFVIVNVIPSQGPALSMCSGTHNVAASMPGFQDFVQCVDDVSPIELAVDPINRKAQVSRCEIRCVDDGHVRTVSQLAPLKGARVLVRLSPVENNPAVDTIRCWQGTVEEVLMGGGFVTFQCADALRLEGEVPYYGRLVGYHPLEAIVEILRARGIPDSMLDLEAFNPDSLVHTTNFEISHLVANDLRFERGGGEVNRSDVGPLLDHIDALAIMCGGGVHVNEAGLVTFSRYSEPAAADGTWDEYDIVDLEVTQVYEGLINEVSVEFGNTTEFAGSYIRRDTQSQSDFKIPDSDATAHSHSVRMPYAGSVALIEAIGGTDEGNLDLSDNSFTIAMPWPWTETGVAGSRLRETFRGLPSATVLADVIPFTQPPGGGAGNPYGRPVYIQIEEEIIRLRELALDTDSGGPVPDVDKFGRSAGTVTFRPLYLDVTNFERGWGGTTAVDHATDVMVDITAPVLWATTLLERCRNGLPKLKVRTTLALFKYTLGDIVELTTDEFFWWGVNGLTAVNSIWWEVTRKQFHLIEGWIEWELTFSKIATPQSTASTEDIARPHEGPPGTVDHWNITNDQSETIPGSHGGSSAFPVLWDAEVVSASGTMDSDTGLWTCERPGNYRIRAQVTFDTSGDFPDAAWLALHVNGSEVARGSSLDALLSPDARLAVETTLALSIDDEVEIIFDAIDAPSGGTAVVDNATAGTFLTIEYLGPA